jgi:hypothetical protein
MEASNDVGAVAVLLPRRVQSTYPSRAKGRALGRGLLLWWWLRPSLFFRRVYDGVELCQGFIVTPLLFWVGDPIGVQTNADFFL